MVCRTAPFSMTLNDPKPRLQGQAILWGWIGLSLKWLKIGQLLWKANRNYSYAIYQTVRPRNLSSRATRSIQDNHRSTRSIDLTFDASLDSTRLWSTAIDSIDLIDFLVDSLALLPVASIVCVVREIVKPFRGRVLMYRHSGLTDEGLPSSISAS